MGVSIHYTLGQPTEHVKGTLDRTQELAAKYQADAKRAKIEFSIRRISDIGLLIDIGHCETLAFQFQPFGKAFSWLAGHDNKYKPFDAHAEDNDSHSEPKKLWASRSCKTQFAASLAEHKWVAELVRCVARQCETVSVHDEGSYYHSLMIEDASEAIAHCGAAIDKVMKTLSSQGCKVIAAQSTKIKSLRQRDRNPPKMSGKESASR